MRQSRKNGRRMAAVRSYRRSAEPFLARLDDPERTQHHGSRSRSHAQRPVRSIRHARNESVERHAEHGVRSRAHELSCDAKRCRDRGHTGTDSIRRATGKTSAARFPSRSWVLISGRDDRYLGHATTRYAVSRRRDRNFPRHSRHSHAREYPVCEVTQPTQSLRKRTHSPGSGSRQGSAPA
jgi:hypothetical protein